ncbi:MAG: hypothetical protein ABFD18_17085 [Syntrophomonas sp.]
MPTNFAFPVQQNRAVIQVISIVLDEAARNYMPCSLALAASLVTVASLRVSLSALYCSKA